MGRLLERVEDVVVEPWSRRGELWVAVLPTGYGKTSLFARSSRIVKSVRGGVRVIHVLPLRAIVTQAYERAERVYGALAGYQAGIDVGGAKTPYLARRYVIATLDSFLMNYYGVPVYEALRSSWHSDAVYASSRLFDVLVLDEFHLMVAGDAGSGENPVRLVAKQLAATAFPVASHLRRGPAVILTATMPPDVLRAFIAEVAGIYRRYGGGELMVNMVAYRGLFDARGLSEQIKEAGQASVDSVIEDDDNSFPRGRIKTSIKKIDYVDGVPDPGVVANIIRNAGDCRVFVALNSWVRAYRLYKELEELGINAVLLTGKSSPEGRRKALERLEKGGAGVLVATQVVEAGVDLDFNVLITEAAPGPQLVQRAGRIARRRDPTECDEVVVLVPSDDLARAVGGIYSEGSAAAALNELEKALGSGGGGFFDWRIDGARRLVEASGAAVVKELEQALGKGLMQALGEARRYEAPLESLLSVAQAPLRVIEVLEDRLRGSFARASALIPLVPGRAVKEACGDGEGCTGRKLREAVDPHVVSVDVETLMRLAEGGNAFVVVALCSGEDKCKVYNVQVRTDRLVWRPLSTLRSALYMPRPPEGWEDAFIARRIVGVLLRDEAYDWDLGVVKPVRFRVAEAAEAPPVKERAPARPARRASRSRSRRRGGGGRRGSRGSLR